MLKRVLTALLLSSTLATVAAAPDGGWRTAWPSAPDSDGPALPAQTLRQVVRTSTGGSAVRVRLSNQFGKAPLTIGAARVGLSAGGARVAPGSDRPLSFGGRPAVTIAAGGSRLSDPVDLAVGALQPLAGTRQFYSEAVERRRLAVNAWIRTAGAFDAVVDFDAALRDPRDPARLNPAYDSGDHLHRNEAGYRRMAQKVDLHLLNR
jgi:hypothetical protein